MRRRTIPRTPLALALTTCLLGACAVGPDFNRPQLAVPDRFLLVDSPTALAPATRSPAAPPPAPAAARAMDSATWWHALQDPELDSLVSRAVAGNLDLEIALTRLQEARSFEVALTGYALPRIELAGGGGHGTGSDMSRGRVPGALGSGDRVSASAAPITRIAGADAFWDLDLFGRFRRQIEAARYDAQAAAAARDAVQIAVVADVVRAYVDLRGLQMQYAVLRQNLRASRDLLDVVQARFDRGMTNELDLTLARRQYASVQAAIAPVSSQVDAAIYAIAALLGQYPDQLQAELAPAGPIPQIPDAVAPGQPLELIRRRPDIRAAEWELAGATARIGVATASLLPQISLSAGLGRQIQSQAGSPTSSQRIWSAGYGAVFPLLDFGTLDALVGIADLQARERLLQYKRTVQGAVQEVDTAIAGYLAQQERVARLGEAVVAGQRAMELATQRYDRGLTDFLNVVDAQRQEYDLEAQYVLAEMGFAEQFVALYRSLGGGWEQFNGPPPLRTPLPAVAAILRRAWQSNQPSLP